ncbi:flagellar motor protein MotB [Halomonas sp. Bachu 37]|uniref:flagellar motor protein MotB n=1 Tax=Halomonas kashgarensis TaxID=3084920 RepID=UPI003216FEF2
MNRKSNIPAWMVTYADLMTLLLCFFVLLLSFAEIDADKFRRIAGELSKAFGVQRDIEAMQIPKGTSAVFDQFSPAAPDRTLLDEIRQRTMEENPELETLRNLINSRLQRQVEEVAARVETLLQDSIEEGVTHVEVEHLRVVIRIEEKGTFLSGSANVTQAFAALLVEMAEVLEDLPGTVAIDGHTDNVPIRTARFQSNWDLSAMRAASVANVLLLNPELASERLVVQGFADTQPRADNATAEGRAQNRRVEITIDLSEATEERGVTSLQRLAPPVAEPPAKSEAVSPTYLERLLPAPDLMPAEETLTAPINPFFPEQG